MIKPIKEWTGGHRGKSCGLEDLRTIPALSRLLPVGQKRLIQYLHIRHYTAGEILYVQGEPAMAAFFLLSGSIALYYEENDKRDRIKVVAPGEGCGYATLSSDTVHGEQGIAAEESRVIVMLHSAFNDLATDYPSVAKAILQGVASEALRDWRNAFMAYRGLTDHLTRSNIIV